MATAVVMPKQGNSVESCLIMAWKKQIGDSVKVGDVLAEVETDKAVLEVESQVEGILLARFFEVGEDVPVMTNIAVIGELGEAIDSFRPASIQQEASNERTPAQKTPVQQPVSAPMTHSSSGEVFVSPRARMLADKYGVNMREVTPSGPDGRIIERDVQAVMNARSPLTPAARELAVSCGEIADCVGTRSPLTPAARELAGQGEYLLPAFGSGFAGRITVGDLKPLDQQLRGHDAPVEAETEVIPLRGIRNTIADRMRTSLQETAQLTMHVSADARAMLAYRKRLKASSESLGLQKVSLNDLLMFVLARVLLDYPELNATLEEKTMTRYSAVHLAFAVDTPRGLIVPVVKNAHRLSLKQLANETARLTAATQDMSIKTDELSGGTFTITNLGALGVEHFTPIINPPQVAILGVGKVDLKPIQVDDAGVQFIPHMYLSLTIDHQVVDGAPAARFLQALIQALAEIDLWLAM